MEIFDSKIVLHFTYLLNFISLKLFVTSGFRRRINEIFAILRHYAA